MFINQLFESAYSDGVSDGIQGRANPRASSIYGPESNEYHRGYADGVVKGKEQKQARVAQAKADEEPYENMSTAELEQILADIQQRTNERHKIYSKLRGADYSFDPKRHLPPNDADLKVQSAADNKAWNTIHQVLWQRKQQGISEAGSPAQQAAIAIAMKKAHKKPKSEDIDEEKVRLDPKCWTGYHKAGTKMKGGVRVNNCVKNEDQNVAEGAEFGAYYSEQLAQRVFDANPNLDDEDAILNAGYAIAKKEMGSRANGIFRNEDFPSDFVSAYGWLKKNQGVAEGFFGIDDKIKGRILNIVERLSDEYGMWDHKAQTFTPEGLETLKSILKFNEKYIKYALSLTHKDYEAEGVAEVSDRDPGALASRAHIASQERKHQAWAAKQKELEDEFYANHPELDDRHKSVDNLVKEFDETLSRMSK